MEVEKNMTSFLNPNVQLDRFDGTNFTRWKGKLFFLLTVLKIAYVLDPKLEPLSEPRRSQREKKEKNLAPDFISSQALTFLVEGDRNGVLNKIPLLLNIEEDPKTFNEAMSSRDASFWREAVNDEMDSIISNQTWILVDLPPGSKPISNKWVFRRKYNTDGSIQTFKARLVAKGFKQK